MRRLVLLIWLCFLARGAFNAVLLPLWEGFDEWAHFSYAQQLASGGGLPVPGQATVSPEVAGSLSMTPLPYGHHKIDQPWLTHDAWWKLSRRERGELRPPAAAPPLNHEAQQPPLYYLLMAPVEWAAGQASLPARVLLMRLASLLIASLTVPFAFAAARRVLPGPAAAAVAALIAAMPGFVMTAGRAGNDGISAAIFAAIVWLALRERPPGLSLGALLGAGLLTKAYFLTAVPAIVALYAWKRRWRPAAVALLTAGAISGWWYWRNYTLTGSWSGLQQVVAQRDIPLWSLAGRIPDVDWLRFFDIAFLSHIWIGNWSFLQVRGWMYRVFAVVAAAAVAGLVLRLWRDKGGRSSLAVPAAFYGFFWLGLCYHELTFSALGLSSSAGWYLYAVVVAEALLVSLGLTALGRGAWVLPAVAALFALLDLYATHFLLLPYYTGLIAHRPDGGLASLQLTQLADGGFSLMLSRLMLPPAAAAALWLAFLAATLALPVVAGRAVRSRLS